MMCGFELFIKSMYFKGAFASLANVLTVIIKRKPKTTYKTETKKYLFTGDTLIDIDPKEFYNYNWGNFKFSTEKYGR